jgi:hypothetical protein
MTRNNLENGKNLENELFEEYHDARMARATEAELNEMLSQLDKGKAKSKRGVHPPKIRRPYLPKIRRPFLTACPLAVALMLVGLFLIADVFRGDDTPNITTILQRAKAASDSSSQSFLTIRKSLTSRTILAAKGKKPVVKSFRWAIVKEWHREPFLKGTHYTKLYSPDGKLQIETLESKAGSVVSLPRENVHTTLKADDVERDLTEAYMKQHESKNDPPSEADVTRALALSLLLTKPEKIYDFAANGRHRMKLVRTVSVGNRRAFEILIYEKDSPNAGIPHQEKVALFLDSEKYTPIKLVSSTSYKNLGEEKVTYEEEVEFSHYKRESSSRQKLHESTKLSLSRKSERLSPDRFAPLYFQAFSDLRNEMLQNLRTGSHS